MTTVGGVGVAMVATLAPPLASAFIPFFPTGRCIKQVLTCNKQNDCGDNSDERDCTDFTTVCPAEKRVAPGADLLGNG